MNKRLIVLYFLLLSFGAVAQSFSFEPWDTGNVFDGFGSFTCSLVDSSGALWVGSSSSQLAKYADDEWEVFNVNTLLDGSLGSAYFQDLHQDSKGNIWIVSDEGVIRKNAEGWMHFDEELEKGFGYTIAEKADTMYFSTRGGIMTYDGENWGYQAVKGNQAGYVAVDKEGYVWASFSNGDGNHKYVNGVWEEVSDVCTTNVLDNATSPNGDLWFLGASGAMCSYDGANFTDYRIEGGIIYLLNAIGFSPSGDHVFIGGEADVSGGKKIKHFYQNELVESYNSDSGLPEGGNVAALSMTSEDEIVVFFADEIYRGFRISSSKEVQREKLKLVSNLVEDELVIKGGIGAEFMIFSSQGSLMKVGSSRNGIIGVSGLSGGVYFLSIKGNELAGAIKFVKI